MKKIKAAAAYTIAFLMTLVVLATFMGMNFWAEKLVAMTNLKVAPKFSGGEIRNTIDHGTYQTLIHRPVFDGLFCETSHGFVQVVWRPLAHIPETIEEAVDYDHDGKTDFIARLNTETLETQITPCTPQVKALERTTKLKEGILIRVQLTKSR
jgi:hypothetical protein